MTGQYEKSIATYKKALKVSPKFIRGHVYIAACHSAMGSYAEAAAAVKEVLRLNPKFTVESYTKNLFYKNKSDIERMEGALRKAGLPEKSAS
jgi:tetratricopeptide (TPR) repeat protein